MIGEEICHFSSLRTSLPAICPGIGPDWNFCCKLQSHSQNPETTSAVKFDPSLRLTRQASGYDRPGWSQDRRTYFRRCSEHSVMRLEAGLAGGHDSGRAGPRPIIDNYTGAVRSLTHQGREELSLEYFNLRF